MAEKLEGEGKKKGAGKGGSKRKKDGGEGMGHNLVAIRKAAEPIFKRLLKLQTDMETSMGEFRVDFKNLYEEGAKDIGCSRGVLRSEFRKMLRRMNEEAEEKEMETVEREQIETLRAAMGDTPMGAYFEAKLAPAPN